jgi:hypothetical protein
VASGLPGASFSRPLRILGIVLGGGFFSVITSIASTILAMLIGFNLLLQIALALYAIAALSLSRLPHGADPSSSDRLV